MGRRNSDRGATGLALIKINPSKLESHILDEHAGHCGLLFLKFVAQHAECSDFLGRPGFSPAEAKFLSLGFSR
jgi:hypothetical protein